MELIFFGFIGCVIAVTIVGGYRRAGRRRTRHDHNGGDSWIFWPSSADTTGTHHDHAHSHHSHGHDHSHHSGGDQGGHSGHDSGGCCDSGSGCDSGGGGGDGGGSSD